MGVVDKLWNCSCCFLLQYHVSTLCGCCGERARGSYSTLPGLQICPDFCSALMSLLWLKCKAKQPTLLYISQPVPADMSSLKHFWARDISLVCSVLLGEKNVSYFFLSLWQRVTFFDISTASLVVQHLPPDALIESPMSNRKRNECFIELELSLVMVGGRDRRGEPAAMWVSVGVSSLAEGYFQP